VILSIVPPKKTFGYIFEFLFSPDRIYNENPSRFQSDFKQRNTSRNFWTKAIFLALALQLSGNPLLYSSMNQVSEPFAKLLVYVAIAVDPLDSFPKVIGGHPPVEKRQVVTVVEEPAGNVIAEKTRPADDQDLHVLIKNLARV
jgi:hypothetical protein